MSTSGPCMLSSPPVPSGIVMNGALTGAAALGHADGPTNGAGAIGKGGCTAVAAPSAGGGGGGACRAIAAAGKAPAEPVVDDGPAGAVIT